MDKTIYLDMDLCVGCGACIVACMDQNDIYPERGQPAFRRTYTVEEGRYPDASVLHLSTTCMHCEDAPCLIGCPTGAIARDSRTGAVTATKDLCIGCHSCALACPFGVPRYDSEGKIHKCNLCAERVEVELQPACVRVCPTGALEFRSTNEALAAKEYKTISAVASAAHRITVRM